MRYCHKNAFELLGKRIKGDIVNIQSASDVVAKSGSGVDNVIHRRRDVDELGRLEVCGGGPDVRSPISLFGTIFASRSALLQVSRWVARERRVLRISSLRRET